MIDKRDTQQILGCLMKKPQLLSEIDKYSFILTDFPSRFERSIFMAINGLYRNGATKIQPIDIENFIEPDQVSAKVFKDKNGIEYLQDIIELSEVDNFDFYYNRFKMFNLLKDLKKQGFDTGEFYCEDLTNPKAEEINEFYIGFIIGPCLNSAGRLKNAKIAYDLLEETDPIEAGNKAKELSELNDERKDLTRNQTAEADLKIRDTYPDMSNLPKVLVIYLPSAHESVAGIIAGRLKDLYSRPALVITNSDDGMKGSGRSVEAYDLIGEMHKHADLFKKFGGHKKAAGFSLNDGVTPEDISRQLNDNCHLSVDELAEKIWVDMELPFKYVSESFVNELQLLQPFGLGNERPLFARRNVLIRKLFVLGKNQNVLKLLLEDEEGSQLEAVLFGPAEQIQEKAEWLQPKMTGEEKVSVFYHPDINEFRNQKIPQARIVDIC